MRILKHPAGYCWPLLLCLCVVNSFAPAASASDSRRQPAAPVRNFYVVSEFFSDFGPSWYYYILEVKPDGSDTLVRYIRLANLDLYCHTITVQLAEARLKARSPSELTARNNPCAVSRESLERAIKQNPRRESLFDSVRHGIVANCEWGENVLRLPFPEEVDLHRVNRQAPAIARLWQLQHQIKTLAFGTASVFGDLTEARNLELQRAGESVVLDLRSARFDKGLWSERQSFRDLLRSYRGPLPTPRHTPRLFTPLIFAFYQEPEYPLLAKLARIQGAVELELTVSPESGAVSSVKALSGHPLLLKAAVAAAEKWRLKPNAQTVEKTLKVSLDFVFRCP